MKIGLGLYREQLTPDNFQFALQAGATHLVVGRPITAGADPRAAAQAITAEIALI